MDEKIADIRKKIIAGLALTRKRLIEAKAKEDAALFFLLKGKIVTVKARDLLAKQ